MPDQNNIDTIEGKPALLAHIKAAFPELVWSDSRYIDEGWDHEVIILDNRIVFRFPTDKEYTTKLKVEIEVLKYLKPFIKTAIPDYTYIPTPLTFAGYPIVKGEMLTPAKLDSLNSHHRNLLVGQLADFLTVIHTQPVEKIPIGKVEISMLSEDQLATKNNAEKYLKSKLSLEDWSIVQTTLDEVDTIVAGKHPVTFIHNDVYSRHLLWDSDAHEAGIIDFSDMTVGDPAIDFSEIHEYGFDFVQEVYDLYRGPKDNTFLKRAWTYQKWAAVYMMTDYFEYQKTSFGVAKETFDRIKTQQKLSYS